MRKPGRQPDRELKGTPKEKEGNQIGTKGSQNTNIKRKIEKETNM